jgi:uncharacterized cupin superfamily protein
MQGGCVMTNVAEAIEFFNGNDVQMKPAPINASWIIEGAPVARNFVLSSAREGGAFTMLWDCTAGVFNWHYDADETVYVLKGAVVVRDGQGVEHRLGPGDHMLFRAGSRAVWRVDDYVQKVAFLRTPIPWLIMLPLLGLKKIGKIAKASWSGAMLAALTKASMILPPEILDLPDELICILT